MKPINPVLLSTVILPFCISSVFTADTIFTSANAFALDAVAPSIGPMMSGPIDGKVYGRLNASYQYEDNEIGGEVWKLESNASRLGFKGKTLLENEVSIIYQIEYGVEVDDGDKNGQTFSQRDTWVGVDVSWGQVKGGRITIPFKEAKGPFDGFNDLQGELGKIIDGEERVSNVLQYQSRELMRSVVATVAIVPGENRGVDGEDGPADGVSGSLVVDREQIYLGFGFNSNIKDQDQYRLVCVWKLNALSVGALYQHSEMSDEGDVYIDGISNGNAYGFSSTYSIAKDKFKFQYISSERSVNLSDSKQLSIAIDHRMSTNTTFYGYIADRDADQIEENNSYYAVGFKHQF